MLEQAAGVESFAPVSPGNSQEDQRGHGMAKSGHTFAKRKREQEKKAKAAAKRAKRAAQKRQSDSTDLPQNGFDEHVQGDGVMDPGINETQDDGTEPDRA